MAVMSKTAKAELVLSHPTMCLHCHLIVEMFHERGADPVKGSWQCPRCGHKYLFLNFPVGEQILMATPWALPGSLYGIGAPLVEHLHDQVAMQTHGRMAVDHIGLCGLCHDWHEYLLIG